MSFLLWSSSLVMSGGKRGVTEMMDWAHGDVENFMMEGVLKH
jgi:hypothetical protein